MCASYNTSTDMYPLNFATPGCLFIFNNRNFQNGLEEREGSELDVQRLFDTFGELNFDVECYINKTAKQLRTCIKKISNETDYTNIGSILIFIMSHGKENKIFGTDGEEVDLSEFIDPFKTVESLKEKPKLFFVNASRESRMTPVHDNAVEMDAAQEGNVHLNETAKIKIDADCFYGFSTVDNYFSIKESKKVSWFVQLFCDMIEQHKSTRDLLGIMTKVNDLVKRKEAIDEDGRLVKMQSTCTLRKDFYFSKPKF